MKRSKIIQINSPDLGIFANVPIQVINSRGWSDALNVRFINGRVETSPGWAKYTAQSLSSPVKHIAQYFKYNGIDYAVAITNSSVWYYDSGTDTWIDITGTALTGITNDFVQSDTAFDTFMFTNNVDRIRKWTGPPSLVANLGGLDTAIGASGTVDVSTAKGITSFAGFMHIVAPIEDGTRYPQRWRWSRFQDNEGWNNLSTYGQAGYADITDGADAIQTTKRLGGDLLAIYKDHSIHIAQYVGPPTVWSRRLVVSGLGLLAPGAVTDLINEHVLISNDNVYVFNGGSLKPIGDAIFDRFISELNPAKVHLIWSHTIYESHEVIFGYPSGGSSIPNRAMVLNYKTGAWTFRDMPFLTMGQYRRTSSGDSWDSDADSWDSDTTRWDDASFAASSALHLGGDNNGYVHDYGDGYSQDGDTHNSYAISPAIDLKRPDIIKRFLKIYAILMNTGGFNLEISYLTTNNPNITLDWSASKSMACDLSTNPWITLDISGRYLFLRFRTNGIANPWKLTSYGCEYVERGRH